MIGGVAAGPAAAAEAKRVDPAAEVVLFERDDHISYGACEIPYYVGATIRELETLVVFSPEEFENAKGVKVFTRTEVLELHPGKHRLVLEESTSGRRWEERFDKFILAVGASPAIPDVEGIGATNVFPVRDLSHASGLRKAVERVASQGSSGYASPRIVIVGGGYIGVEMADVLARIGHRVTILQPGGRLLPDYFDEALSLRFTRRVAESVSVRDERLTRIVRDPANRVQAVETSIGERIGCGVVVLAAGVRVNTKLAEAAGLRLGSTGAIRVSTRMRTSSPNVWACGDCIEVMRIPDGKPIHSPLSPTAYRTARVAARNAASRGRTTDSTFEGVTPASALKAFDREAATVGLTLADALESGIDAHSVEIRHLSRAGMLPEARPIHVTLIFEHRTGRLLGGQLLGEEGAALRANVLVPLIRRRAHVSELADLDLIYTPPLAPSLDPLYIAARAAIRRLEGENGGQSRAGATGRA